LSEYASIDQVGFPIWRHNFQHGDHDVILRKASSPACDIIGLQYVYHPLVILVSHGTFILVVVKFNY